MLMAMVVMPMVMIVVVIVVMFVVVMGVVVVVIGIGVELFGSHSLFCHLGKLEDIVDHLVLEDRRSKFGKKLRVVSVIVVDLAFLARELPHTLEQRSAHLFVSDGNLIAGADL
jgi:hypothetical protein